MVSYLNAVRTVIFWMTAFRATVLKFFTVEHWASYVKKILWKSSQSFYKNPPMAYMRQLSSSDCIRVNPLSSALDKLFCILISWQPERTNWRGAISSFRHCICSILMPKYKNIKCFKKYLPLSLPSPIHYLARELPEFSSTRRFRIWAENISICACILRAMSLHAWIWRGDVRAYILKTSRVGESSLDTSTSEKIETETPAGLTCLMYLEC